MKPSVKTQDAITDLKASIIEIISEENTFGCTTSSAEELFEKMLISAVNLIITDRMEQS